MRRSPHRRKRGPRKSSNGSEPVAACDLLENGEVSDALGQEVSGGVDDELDVGVLSLRSCQWMTDAAPISSISVNVVGEESITTGEPIEDVFNGVVEAIGDAQSEEGIGDRAFMTDGELHVLAGPYYLTVQAVGGDVPDAALRELAELAVTRL